MVWNDSIRVCDRYCPGFTSRDGVKLRETDRDNGPRVSASCFGRFTLLPDRRLRRSGVGMDVVATGKEKKKEEEED